jgi:membrane carboxypeptidase/penicillin-binding protein
VRGHIPVSQGVISYIRDAMYGVISEKTGTGYGLYHDSNFPLGKVLVGGKTGTAELPNTDQDGSWFASFAGPAGGAPQYVTVIEVNKGDQGAITAAPTSLKVWDALYGLQGQKAIFPNGVPPNALPKLGVAAVKAKAARAAKRHRRAAKTTGTTGTPSPPPSPTNSAAGLPPAVVVRSDGILLGSLS